MMLPFDASQFRAVLLDVDRTLTNSKGEVSQRTKEALSATQKKGWSLALVTGRGLAECLEFLPLFPPNQVHILSGGAQLVHGDGTIATEVALPSDVVQALCQKATDLGADFGFPQGAEYFASPSKKERKRSKNVPVGEILNLKTWSTPLLSLGALTPELVEFVHTFPNLNVKEMTDNNGEPYLDITRGEFSKATGAAQWAAEYGLGITEIIAVGDGNNDLEILEAVGWGVAMANAPYQVREAADQVVGHCDDDGLAKFLERLPPLM